MANVTKINSLLLGLKPYAGLSAVDLIEQLKKGYRMEKPNGCSDEMWDIPLSLFWKAGMIFTSAWRFKRKQHRVLQKKKEKKKQQQQ